MRGWIGLASVLMAGCGVAPVSSTPIPRPVQGVVWKIEANATPGIGQTGGTATVSAHVFDAYFASVVGASVTFSTDSGTFTSATPQTDEQGHATAVLSATPGVVKVTVSSGAVQSPEILIAIQPHR